jgi:hypothetical protein
MLEGRRSSMLAVTSRSDRSSLVPRSLPKTCVSLAWSYLFWCHSSLRGTLIHGW